MSKKNNLSDDEKALIIRDTREQNGWRFNKSSWCSGIIDNCLKFGDYSIKDHEDLIIIERKNSVSELCSNIGKNRKRFERELQGIKEKGIKFKYVLVEDYYSSIYNQKFSSIKPTVIWESIFALQIKYEIPFIFAGTRKMARDIARTLLKRAYLYRLEGIV